MQKQEIYFETYGCTANKNSTQIMQGLVIQAGLNLTTNPEIADLIIINSCIVKDPTEQSIRRKIQDYLKQGKKVILAGCMSRLYAKKLKQSNLYFLDTTQVKNVVNLIKDILKNSYKEEKYLSLRNEVKLSLVKVSEKPIAITQISEGCLGECAYCIVRLAKGKLFSYPIEEVLSSIKKDIELGSKEIQITSQDCASYGNDSGKYLLPELLKKITEIKGNFKIRLGMINPNNIFPILDDLTEIYKHKKMFKFIHIPIQSGSNKVLKEMKRKYKIEDVLKIIKKFKEEIPEILISTDIIVGYPTETEQDFEETLSLIKEIKPEILNRSNFYSRPFTEAEKLKPLALKIISKRAKTLQDLHLEICASIQKEFIGKEFEVLLDEKGFPGTFLGRTSSYKLVAIQSKEDILGKTIKVKIKSSTPHYLIGEIT